MNLEYLRDHSGDVWEIQRSSYVDSAARLGNRGGDDGVRMDLEDVSVHYGPMRPMPERYRDPDGGVWYRLDNGRYTLFPDDSPGVAYRYLAYQSGPLVPVDEPASANEDRTVGARYIDADGDTWEDIGGDVLRLVDSPHRHMVGIEQTWSEVESFHGPLVDADDQEETDADGGQAMPGAFLRDKDDDRWESLPGGLVRHVEGSVGAPMAFSDANDRWGPFASDTGEENDADDGFMGKTFVDRDGDRWWGIGDGDLRLVLSAGAPDTEGMEANFYDVADAHGPLINEDEAAGFGDFLRDDADQEDTPPASTRAEALTVGVMLAKLVHGEGADGHDVALTADDFARRILRE